MTKTGATQKVSDYQGFTYWSLTLSLDIQRCIVHLVLVFSIIIQTIQQAREVTKLSNSE